MALLPYTTNNEVRAILGVTDNELSDDALGLGVYERNLKRELRDAGTNVTPIFRDFLAIPASSRSETQIEFIEAVQVFSTYAVARQLGSALPMFAPKEMGDGKSVMQRFGVSPYQDTLKTIETMYNRAQLHLVSAYAAVQSMTGQTQLRSYMVVSSPSSDRVTG